MSSYSVAATLITINTAILHRYDISLITNILFLEVSIIKFALGGNQFLKKHSLQTSEIDHRLYYGRFN